MRKILKILFIILAVVFLGYLLMPNPRFPNPPPDALQSNEPADTETPLRRAYFTNLTREEVMNHYQKEFGWGYRLNYPPEEAQDKIRDQTRSTFLEEVVHPFRESVFVNGFEPKDLKDTIEIGGRLWRQKITVRYVPSSFLSRLAISSLSLGLLFLLIREYSHVGKA